MKKQNNQKDKPTPPVISEEVSAAFNEIFHCVSTEGFELSMLPGFFSGKPVVHLIAVDKNNHVMAPIAYMYENRDIKYITGMNNEPLMEIPDETSSDIQ